MSGYARSVIDSLSLKSLLTNSCCCVGPAGQPADSPCIVAMSRVRKEILQWIVRMFLDRSSPFVRLAKPGAAQRGSQISSVPGHLTCITKRSLNRSSAQVQRRSTGWLDGRPNFECEPLQHLSHDLIRRCFRQLTLHGYLKPCRPCRS